MSNSLSGSYTSNVPLATQQTNNSQPLIGTNFSDIANLISVNHIPFNTSDTFGQHNYVTYYNQTVIPSAATNQMVIYSTVNDDGTTALNYQYPNSSTVYTIASGNNAGSSNGGNGAGYGGSVYGGYQYLAGSILMQFTLCVVTATPSGNLDYSGTQTFSWSATGSPGFTQTPFYIEAFPVNIGTSGVPATEAALSTGFIEVIAIDNLTFTITVESTTNVEFYAMAIGL